MKHNALRLTASLAFTAAAFAPGVVLAADGPAPAPGVYLIDATIAPVVLDGTYPIAVHTAAGDVEGSIALATDVKGALAGALTIGGRTFDVKGKASSTTKGFRVSMTAKDGSSQIAFAGSFVGPNIDGTSKGKGAVAAGKNTFTIDASGARPQVASIVATLTPGTRGALVGTAMVTVDGAPMPLKVSGKPGKSFKLTFSAKGFKFTGKGAGPIAWSVTGFGADVKGTDLPLNALAVPSGLAYEAPSSIYEEEEPIEANFPKTFMPPYTTFAVAPALPAGLSIDVGTGVISGVPTTATNSGAYTVTATNPAGSTQADVTVGVRLNHGRSFAPDTDPRTDDDLRHFLRRTQWGVRPVELDALRTGGVDAYVDAMLVFPATTQAETDAAPLLTTSTDLAGNFPSSTAIAQWWTSILVNTPAPFQETLAFFWHDHFGVSSVNFDSSESRWIVQHVNLLRDEGNGNLRTLLLDVARDPAMLKFLDGFQSTKRAPNENFAREFWELFTLGVDNGYTQADIIEAAKAWTGYRERYDSVTGLQNLELDLAGRHDTGAKNFLGQTIAGQNATDDFAAVVDITLQHRNVAEFITKKLFAYFCYENPPQSLVDVMAANLRANNYELTPFLKALFRSEAFFSKKARRSLVKSPLEFTLGFMRSTGLTLTTAPRTDPVTMVVTPPLLDVSAINSSLTNQAQLPSQPPTVDGWPSGDLWLAAQGFVERINLVRSCVDDTTDQARIGINVANLLPPVADRTPDAVIDTLAKLLDVQLSTQDRVNLAGYLNTSRDSAGVITSSPFDGSLQTHLDTRVRGLVYALTQHPTYHSR